MVWEMGWGEGKGMEKKENHWDGIGRGMVRYYRTGIRGNTPDTALLKMEGE